jgi:hypothetical protein
MDIEGAEFPALKGAVGLISKWRPILYIEINDMLCDRYDYQYEAIFEFLDNLSYRSFIQSKFNGFKPINQHLYIGMGNVWFIPHEEIEIIDL